MPEESNPTHLLQAARTSLTTKADELLQVYLIIPLITTLCYVINNKYVGVASAAFNGTAKLYDQG